MTTDKPGLGWRIYQWTLTHGGQARSIWLLALASVGDFFIPALPTQSSVILLTLLQPQRSRQIVLAFVLAAASGTAILAVLAQLLESFLAANLSTEPWSVAGFQLDIRQQMLAWGSLLLLVLSLLPTPPRLAVIMALSLGLPWYEVVIAVAAGKLVWFSLVVWLVRLAPATLQKIPLFGRVVSQFRQDLVQERL